MQRQIKEIIDLYGDYLLRIAYTYVKDNRIAEEILQDVIFTYYRKQKDYRGDASLKTYLTRITINRCYDYLRSWKSKRETLLETIFVHGNTKSIESKYIEKEEKMEITRTVLTLKVKLREVILLYYYAEHTTKEIADLLELPESTIKSRLQKARSVLKEKLDHIEWEVLNDGSGETI